MPKECTCEDREYLEHNSDVIQTDEEYGWVLSWMELTQEDGYTQIHRYGMPVRFCPMCGKILPTITEVDDG